MAEVISIFGGVIEQAFSVPDLDFSPLSLDSEFSRTLS